MQTIELDQTKVEAFGERMLGVLNDAAIAQMLSLGHRTGLFSAMSSLPASTSAQIAAAAGLNERYVREWLGAMVTGRIVDYVPAARTYALPAEHAALLTDGMGQNMGVTMQYFPVLGAVEGRIVEVFRHGGGVPYDAFDRFHEIMAEDSNQAVVAALTDAILPLVPGLSEALQDGIDVLDLGCGQGRAILQLAKAFPNSHFTGYDFEAGPIAAATAAASEAGVANVRYVVRDAAALREHERYDLICTFDAIHDQADPAQVLANIARALRPDGVYLMQDIRASSELHKNLEHPAGTFLYTISTMHCMTVSLAQGGAGLGTVWGEELALAMLADAGFARVELKQPPHDFLNNYYIAHKGL